MYNAYFASIVSGSRTMFLGMISHQRSSKVLGRSAVPFLCNATSLLRHTALLVELRRVLPQRRGYHSANSFSRHQV